MIRTRWQQVGSVITRVTDPSTLRSHWAAGFSKACTGNNENVAADTSPMFVQVSPGQKIDERYIILKQLGEGGIGSVYLARQIDLNRLLAIKFLHPDLLLDRSSRARFNREAQVLSRLRHPLIARVFGMGIWQDEMPYITMEYIEGQSLQDQLAAGPIGWRRTIEIAIQVCQGMSYVHAEGVTHRDLKPSNILILNQNNEETVKIIDFGLAGVQLSSGSGERFTASGLIIGTPQYMSPEQCCGKPSDARSDIYSLSCILYECITGISPFSANTSFEYMQMHVKSKPAPVDSNLRTELPSGLLDVIYRGLEKEPDDRYRSMDEMLRDLELVLSGKGIERKAPLHGKPLIHLSAVAAMLILVLGSISLRDHSRSTPQANRKKISPVSLDQGKAKELVTLSSHALKNSTQSDADRYLLAAIQASRAEGEYSLQLQALTKHANICRSRGKFDDTKRAIDEGFSILSRHPKELDLSTKYKFLCAATAFFENKSPHQNLPRALELCDKRIDLAAETTDSTKTKWIQGTESHRAYIYSKLNQYGAALNSIDKATKLAAPKDRCELFLSRLRYACQGGNDTLFRQCWSRMPPLDDASSKSIERTTSALIEHGKRAEALILVERARANLDKDDSKYTSLNLLIEEIKGKPESHRQLKAKREPIDRIINQDEDGPAELQFVRTRILDTLENSGVSLNAKTTKTSNSSESTSKSRL